MRALLPCLALFLIAACGGQSADIKISNAHIVAPVGANTVSLGGLEITAKGEDIRLNGASTPAAKRIEIHTTNQDADGRMQMRRLDNIVIPAGETYALGSGRTHLMVFGLDAGLVPGDEVALTLTYAQGDTPETAITIMATITDVGQTAHHGS